MVQRLTLADSLSLGDLHTYLQRAGRVEDGSVRLIAGSRHPRGVHRDPVSARHPRREPHRARPAHVRARRHRGLRRRSCRCARSSSASCAHAPRSATTTSRVPSSMSRPPEVNTVTWAGISPPRGGWRPLGETDAATLESAARAASRRSPRRSPTGTGEQLVQRVRSEVWGRGVDGLEYVPAGRGVRRLQPRLPRRRPGARSSRRARGRGSSSRRGHVLVRRKPWTPQGVAGRGRRGLRAPPPVSRAAIARPAARPVKRHPPRKVPSSAR